MSVTPQNEGDGAQMVSEAPFTDDDLRFFEERGYVVLRQAVSREKCDAVVRELFSFLEMDPANSDDWYRLPLTPGGMVEMYQSQALWDNRQNARVYAAFRQILGDHRLWVSFDRANLKPPAHPEHPEYDHGGFIHWDIDPARLDQIPFGVQGVLYLTDTDKSMGGFCCVPGHHKLLERWAATGEDIPGKPSASHPRVPESRSNLAITPIVGSAGDLVIWNKRLLHGNGRNVSTRPRLAQYITMGPADTDNDAVRDDRVRRWQDRLPPDASWAPGDPRNREQTHSQTAILTSLGRRLLGLDSWDAGC